MDYKWTRSITYKAIPTILPFSSFGNNIFYFSILGEIKGKNDKNILFIAAHEISHFIFYDILKKKNIIIKSLPTDFKNYFKEALTAVLLNRKPLCNILNLRDYKGNREIHDLKIKKRDGTIIYFTEFINEYYQAIKIKKKKSFNIFLQEILNILLPFNKEFSKKRAIWNKFGNQLFKNKKAYKIYQYPIKIKEGKKFLLPS